jgi:hypothetical protein
MIDSDAQKKLSSSLYQGTCTLWMQINVVVEVTKQKENSDSFGQIRLVASVSLASIRSGGQRQREMLVVRTWLSSLSLKQHHSASPGSSTTRFPQSAYA